MCEECYVLHNRMTPVLKPLECLQNHPQYICGTCGRAICMECDRHNCSRWKFPFKLLELAIGYLRTADFTAKKSCGIYELSDAKGRSFYKIFVTPQDLEVYLQKNRDKTCKNKQPIFSKGEYKEYPNTEVRKLTSAEIEQYLSEMKRFNS